MFLLRPHLAAIFLISLVFSSLSLAKDPCFDILATTFREINVPDSFAGETLRGIRELSDKRVADNGSRAPTQKDVELDVELYRELKGEESPNFLSGVMVEGLSFVDHPLYLNARDGAVKLGDGGEFALYESRHPL